MPKIKSLSSQYLQRMHAWWAKHQLPVCDKDDKRGLSVFCWQFSGFICLVFMGLLPWLLSGPVPYWPLYLSAYLLLMRTVYLPAVYPMYIGWMIIASALAYTNTKVILLVLYVCLVIPMGLFSQLTKRLTYQKRPVANAEESYFIKRSADELRKNHMQDPF